MADGPWSVRVAFAPGGGFAYRPGEVVVREAQVGDVIDVLVPLLQQQRPDLDPEFRPRPDAAVGSFVRFSGIPDALDVIEKLNRAGIYAQPNHVVFAHSSPDPGGVQANPFYANPFYANPFYANPFYANPFYANPFYANPFYANPFYANPFYANPFYANTNPALDPNYQQTGLRPSTARPTEDPGDAAEGGFTGEGIRVVVLDTGYDSRLTQDALHGGDFTDAPDTDPPNRPEDLYLDTVAGHGTFVAGVIRRFVKKCRIDVLGVLQPQGDGDEVQIAQALEALLKPEGNLNVPQFVNLSFGGYSTTGMAVMAEAVASLHHNGTVVVASAGNDATGVPMYPAALPYVVAVGALDHEGNPAPFTNYGPWVRACTLGVEIVSKFFNFAGAHPKAASSDIDDFGGWAVWSGTSFAAPRVLAALIREMRSHEEDPREAVRRLIDQVDRPVETQTRLHLMLGREIHPEDAPK